MPKFLVYLLSLGLIICELKQMVGTLEPPQILEKTGPFQTILAWKQIDLVYPSETTRNEAITNGSFIPENLVPIGIEIYKNRIFLSFTKWKEGIPITLGFVFRNITEASPKITPYPDWKFHTSGCNGLTSIFRMQIDECDRLWIIDTGKIELIAPKTVCPPQLFIFNLKTDELVLKYPLPKETVKEDSIFGNIRVDIRNNKCDEAFAYISDLRRNAIIVFNLKEKRSWRIENSFFFPDPLATLYKLNDFTYSWTDGILGMALSTFDQTINDRTMYFHSLSSFREFYVKTSVLRNETGGNLEIEAFKVLGRSRGKCGQTSISSMDYNGILFFNNVCRNSVGCWDSKKPYTKETLGIIASSNVTLMFPSDLKINYLGGIGRVWVLSNRLPVYFFSKLDADQFNYRILVADIDKAINGTICDPKVAFKESSSFNYDKYDCY